MPPNAARRGAARLQSIKLNARLPLIRELLVLSFVQSRDDPATHLCAIRGRHRPSGPRPTISMRRYGNIPVSFYLIGACAAPPSPDPKVGTVEPFYSKLREEYLSVAFETAAKSMCDLATSYSELQQLRKQVEEAEKRQAIVLANDSRRKPSRAVQDLAAF